MSEEEKKIVEKFKKLYLKDFNHEKIINEERLSYLECALISNLIEKQQKEIKELKEKYDKDTHTLQNQLDIANADRVEKDKIIKLMTKYIADNDITEIFCDDDKFEIDAFGDEVDCDEDCQECVIRFFEDKMREENE